MLYNTHSDYLERYCWFDSGIPSEIIVEFCFWLPLQNKLVSSMGVECADRNIIQPEKF